MGRITSTGLVRQNRINFRSIFHLIVIACTLCMCTYKNKGVEIVDTNSEDFKVLPLHEVEIEMERRFKELEEIIRVEDGITSQSEIDATIQLLINDGHMETPFIVQKTDSASKVLYLTYKEYKEYRLNHQIDTTNSGYTFPILSDESDSLR